MISSRRRYASRISRLAAVLLSLAVPLLAIASSVHASEIPDEPGQSLLLNSFSATRVVDSFALATTAHGILSGQLDPTALRLSASEHLVLSTDPVTLKVFDSVAAVLSEADVVYFIDISNLPALTLLGQADVGFETRDFALNGQDLYLARGFDGVHRLTLTSFNDPVFADSSQIGVHCVQVEARGSNLLVLDDYNGILSYDVAGSGFGTYDTTLFLPKQAFNFALFGDSVFVPLFSHEQMFIGSFAGGVPSLTDTIPLLGLASRVLQTDNYATILLEDGSIEVRPLSDIRYAYVWLPPDSEVGVDGAAATISGSDLLMLPHAKGGVMGYELQRVWSNYTPNELYHRPGPISALTLLSGRLITGGVRNPLDIYTLASDLTSSLDTAYPFLSRISSSIELGGRLVVSQQSPDLVRLIEISGDTVSTIDVGPAVSPPRRLTAFVLNPEDSLSGVAAAGDSLVQVYRVPDSGGIELTGIGRLLGPVSTLAVYDTLLLAADDSRVMYGYRVYDDYSIEPRWTIPTPEAIMHLVRTLPFEVAPGDTVAATSLAFSQFAMYAVDLTTDDLPSLDFLSSLPINVLAGVQVEGRLYTCGEAGVAVFDLSTSPPALLDFGGLGGHIIAANDSVLAVSDGKGVYLYDIGGSGTLNPEIEPAEFVSEDALYNYPNPFNPRTNIAYSLEQAGDVSLTVINTLGQTVRTLVDRHQAAGPYTVEWDGTADNGQRVSSGVYLYRLTTAHESLTRKMVLVK